MDLPLPVPCVARTGTTAAGAAAARRARAELEARLGSTTLPATHPFVVAALKQARATSNDVLDFIKEDGTAQTPHPVRLWLDAVEELED